MYKRQPEYRRIRPIINEIGKAPVIALTATATPKVRIDVYKRQMLNIPEEVLENYAKEMLKKQESVEGLVNRAAESKLSAALKAKATLKMCIRDRLYSVVMS